MKYSLLHLGIIVSGLVTAYLHISLYPDFGYFDWVVLNGFGTIALLLAYFLPVPGLQAWHWAVHWTLFSYMGLTILLWLLFGDRTFQFATTAAIGYYAKMAELFLLLLLWFDRPDKK